MTVPLMAYQVYFIRNIACQYFYLCVWLIINFLPSNVSFLIILTAAISSNFYIQNCNIICFPRKNSCKRTNIPISCILSLEYSGHPAKPKSFFGRDIRNKLPKSWLGLELMTCILIL